MMIPEPSMHFEYVAPSTLEGVVERLNAEPDGAIYAGGVNLVPQLRDPASSPAFVVDVKGVRELTEVRVDGGCLRIGAVTTHRQLSESALVRRHASAVAAAAGRVGSVQVRNRGTIGGNICAAVPNHDLATVLLLLRAKVELVSGLGTRRVSLEKFFPTYGHVARGRDEVLTAVIIPFDDQVRWTTYEKFQRWALEPTIVGLAMASTTHRWRIVLGNYCRGPLVLEIDRVVDETTQETLRRMRDEVAVVEAITDLQGNGGFRRRAVAALLERALGVEDRHHSTGRNEGTDRGN